MICDDCKQNQATYHEVREVNGYRTDLHLCEACRQKRGKKTDFSLFDSLLDGFGFAPLSSSKQAFRGGICAKCGHSAEEFYRTGLLGCEHCYDQFGSILLPALKSSQAKILHVGKIPGKKRSEADPELEKLKKELAKAVDEEEYETAAQIQEKIKKLQKEGRAS